MTLPELIKALEKAERGNRMLDAEIAELVEDSLDPAMGSELVVVPKA